MISSNHPHWNPCWKLTRVTTRWTATPSSGYAAAQPGKQIRHSRHLGSKGFVAHLRPIDASQPGREPVQVTRRDPALGLSRCKILGKRRRLRRSRLRRHSYPGAITDRLARRGTLAPPGSVRDPFRFFFNRHDPVRRHVAQHLANAARPADLDFAYGFR